MSKGVQSPYSFYNGAIIKDRNENVYVVEITSKKGCILFEPFTGRFHVESDMSHYKPIKENIIECILGFLRQC